jgi:hypothetical protein
MLSKRPGQLRLNQADLYYLDMVGRESFYGRLAQSRDRLFRDEDFAMLYCPDNGRPSVPPSFLAVALLLQAHEKVSDEQAVQHATFDLRWKVALGIDVEEQPFVKSTLQLFRAQLLVHEQAGAIFLASIEEAKHQGFLRGKKRTLTIDTTPIFGKGAVKDTYNLLAGGIVMLVRALAQAAGQKPVAWAARHDLSRYFGSSIKGEAAINWDKQSERQAFLAGIVGDAKRLLELAKQTRARLGAEHPAQEKIQQAAELLCQLLAQDIETDEAGEPTLREGVSKDRMPSATDPQMRHGHKSRRARFDGHKAAVAVDTDEGLITQVDVIAGNAPDNENALELVEASEHNTGCEVDQTLGDCAYGDGQTRQKFKDADRALVAKVPRRPDGQLSKDAFDIDLTNRCVTCPAGHTTTTFRADRGGHFAGTFVFAKRLCLQCPLRAECVRGQGGRTITIHLQEELLQQARAYQATDAFRQEYLKRQVAEHRIARLVQLGIRKSRYFGRAKTRFQLLMAAAVANLTLAWNAAAKRAEQSASFALSCAREWATDALQTVARRVLNLSGFIARSERRFPTTCPSSG